MRDVAIIGFGPTGAVAAAMLGRLGIQTLVVDRSTTIYDKPRAIALDHEIMRVFQALGITDEIAAHVAPYPPSEYLGVHGQVIKRLDAAPPPLPQGWAPNLSFTQPPVEAALRACAGRQPSVEVALGQELVSLAQDRDHVSFELQSEAGTLHGQARYLIACDGATSTVRRKAGLALEDLGFDEPWLVVDVQVGDEALDRLPRVNVQYCEPARPSTYVVGPGKHRRWEIMLHEDEDPALFADEGQVWKLLKRWVGPGEARIWRSATYRFHALVAERWRSGRVFLAGDAAHQQPPFLGQGMCQGVRDAVNLSWKLASVLQDGAPGSLLDSYALERGRHVRELTGIIKTLGRFVCEQDVDKAMARDAALLAEMGGVVKTGLRQDLMPALKAGLLSGQGHRATGTLFPQPRVARGPESLLMDDVVGTGFRLVLAEAVDTSAVPLETQGKPPLKCTPVRLSRGADRVAQADPRIVDLVEREGVANDWFERNGCVAALVRPDHYVFGVAVEASDIPRLIDEATAHFSPALDAQAA